MYTTLWQDKALYRLTVEKKLIGREMPDYRFKITPKYAYFRGKQYTVSKRQLYELTCLISPYYPTDMPRLYVTNPKTLWRRGRKGTINEQEFSYRFCTSKRGLGGCVQICHCDKDDWNESMTCLGVLMKGVLWLEAYEAYL